MSKPVRRITAPNLIAMGNLVRELQRGVLTMTELAEVTGLNINTVERYCAAFYQQKASYIAGWRPDARGYPTIRVYCLGEGVDVPAPVVDRAEKARRLRRTRQALRQEFERTGEVDLVLLAKARGHTVQRVARSVDPCGSFTTGEYGPRRSFR